MALALALRVYRLDARSLWLDEILTSQPAHLSGPGDVVAWSKAALNQMPLFYMFTWFLGHWSDTGVVLRLPALIFGTLLVPSVFVLGRSLFGTLAGLVAGLLTAVMPFAVWYSQEARAYTLLMLLTTLQMYFAFAAVKRGRAINWVGLAGFTILNLYTHYVAIFATVAMAVYVGLFLLNDLVRGTARDSKERLTRIRPALLAGAVVAIAYVPWVPSLRRLLARPDQSLGQIHLNHTANLADLANTLDALGLTGFVLAFLCLGLGATILWAAQGKAVESGLLLAWIGVPLALFSFTAGLAVLAIDVRYIAFMFPAAMIAVGAGVQAASVGVAAAAARVRNSPTPRWPRLAPLVGLLAIVLLLAQVVPALATSYMQSKDDYRAVARHITDASPPGSVVLTVGNYSDWTVICLGYYFRELGSPVTVIDARFLDSATAQQLANSSGAVWGVLIFPPTDQLALLASSGSEKADFVDVTGNVRVVRAADAGLSSLDQARTLLRWELPLEPALTNSVALVGGTPTQ
ncbi:MAG TPA: glycosyltransferase family 39 protein [Candidatus Dormibacteraeota bacterium]|nr:glycosyltransferase family 39 protein [Candidatus Dormibacteraeota bacterium]